MLDTALNNINGILGITIGGVSLATIIGTVIILVKSFIAFRKENKLTKEYIEEAFKAVVFPSNIKLDLSKKIEEPLKTGFSEIQTCLETVLSQVTKGEKLILSVLNEFSHVRKLPEETQEEIKEYLGESTSMIVSLED